MRILKIGGWVIGSVLALLVMVLVAVWLLFDPNDYKDRITAAVKDSTGRELLLPGKLKLSVFPWVAIETGEASLGNPQGFGAEPFLTLQRAKVSVKLLPLLSKKLEIGRIEIDGLDLRLKQNAAGKGNWEEWGPEQASTQEDSASSAPSDIQLAGISISNSRMAFEDMVAEQVNIDIGRVAPRVPIPVDMKMNLLTAPNARALPLAAKFALQVDLDKQRYQLANLALNGEVQPDGAPQVLPWKFATPAADLDLAAQTLADTQFTAVVGKVELDGSIQGTKLIDAPVLTGGFALKELAPREVMQQFGMASPDTRDKTALARFAAQGNYVWQNKVARLDKLKVQLDESALTGRFAYNTANSGMDFALTLDKINLDRYQGPPEAPDAKTEPIELPVDLLKPLRARGTFDVGEIRVGGARLTQLSASMLVQDAVARFGPLKAKLYGGQYNGNIGIDMRSAQPKLTMDEHMVGIDIAALMKEYADNDKLSGKGNLDVKLAATGRSGDALVKTLTGKINLNLQDGAVEGIDVWYAIAQAQSLLKQRQLSAAANTKRTAFESFSASADVVNGVATTQDLLVASQLLRITGSGSSNLVTQALDYSVKAAILKAPPGSDANIAELERTSIPVRITGTMVEPKIRADLAGLVKERAKQEVEERKDEVINKAKDKLKGLFGR